MEQHVGAILRRAFEFSFISNVPVFRSDTPENHLYANQIDHLLHVTRNGRHVLAVIECKGLAMTGRRHRFSSRPRPGEEWFAHYGGQAKDIKKQLLNQARALRQFVNQLDSEPPVIESWLVHETRNVPAMVEQLAPGVVVRAFTLQDFKTHIQDLAEIAQPVSLFVSPFLSELSRGLSPPGCPHPPIRDALRYIHYASRTVDSFVYERYKPRPDRNQIAVTGSAGSGKSVVMAYALCVLASNRLIRVDPDGQQSLIEAGADMPTALRPLSQRRIVCYAMTTFQVESLRAFFQAFKTTFASLDPAGEPAMSRVAFRCWDGTIDPGCCVLFIDEAQDLSTTDQQRVAAWFDIHSNSGFLALALDRQQQLQTSGPRARILEGLSFRSKTIQMRRSYRQPFPVAVSGLALLYRWFSAAGPMVRPDTIPLGMQNTKVPSFRGGLGFRVSASATGQECRISMRNDSHPGNNWRQTVELFHDGTELQRMLKSQDLRKCDVLWLRFQQQDPKLQSLSLGRDFEFYHIDPANSSTFIDRNIKGLEFPIVVLEGVPDGIDRIDEPALLWTARRQLYLCASRAVGFLYLLQHSHGPEPGFHEEVRRLLDQLRRPHRGPHDTGFTWRLSFQWRPGDVVPVSDYEDALSEPESDED